MYISQKGFLWSCWIKYQECLIYNMIFLLFALWDENHAGSLLGPYFFEGIVNVNFIVVKIDLNKLIYNFRYFTNVWYRYDIFFKYEWKNRHSLSTNTYVL